MKDALQHIGTIRDRIAKAGGCVVLLDFDGTLAPIVSDYEKGRMDPASAGALARVATHFPVAIITGRALSDVRKRVPIGGISFAGNHGLEYFVDGALTRAKIPIPTARALATLKRALRAIEGRHRGVILEDKRYSLSLHYRKALPSMISAIRSAVIEAVAETPGGERLRLIDGDRVLNILPGVRRDKGTAAAAFYASLRRKRTALPVFIGDDVTDEDAFSALRHGITISVGASRPTAAHYCLKRQKDVAAFLDALVSADDTVRR